MDSVKITLQRKKDHSVISIEGEDAAADGDKNYDAFDKVIDELMKTEGILAVLDVARFKSKRDVMANAFCDAQERLEENGGGLRLINVSAALARQLESSGARFSLDHKDVETALESLRAKEYESGGGEAEWEDERD